MPTTRLASYFDEPPAAMIGRTLSGTPGTSSLLDHTVTLGAKVVPRPSDEIMGKAINLLGYGEAHQLLRYESHEAKKKHDKMTEMYIEYGRNIPGFKHFDRVWKIRNAVRAKISESFREYSQAHGLVRTGDTKAQKRESKKFFKQRLLNMRAKFIEITEDIPHLTSEIEQLYKDHVHIEGRANVCPSKHEHGYHLLCMQKWCNTAVYSLMKVAEHFLKKKENKGEHEKAMLKLEDEAKPFTDKCHAIRTRLHQIRAQRPAGKPKTTRKAASDAEDLRKMHAAHRS